MQNLPAPTGGDMPVTLMVDKVPYKAKIPKGDYEWIRLSNRLATSPRTLSVQELAQALTSGHAIALALFTGDKRSRETWVAQQVFGLDFDEDSTLEAFRRRCDQYGVYPAFTYPTFRHTNEVHKFRAIFIMDHLVTDIRVRDFATTLLIRMFQGKRLKPDSQCTDAARLFMGTDKPLVQSNFSARINSVELLEVFSKARHQSDPSHYGSFMKDLAHDLCISVRQGHFGVVLWDDYRPNTVNQGEITVSCNNNIYNTVFPPDFYTSGVKWMNTWYQIHWAKKPITKNTPNTSGAGPVAGPGMNKEVDSKALRRLTPEGKTTLVERCELLREFISGEAHVGHQGRRIIITNLRHLEGGKKWFIAGLQSRSDYTPDSLMSDADRYNMKPEGCRNCHHASECDHKTNLLQQLPLRRRECRRVAEPQPGRHIDETRKCLEDVIQNALTAKDGKVHAIKSDTGVGKTEVLLRNRLNNICVAFPTHRLKQEAFSRYTRMHENHTPFLWPERPALPEGLERVLEHGYRIGLGATTSTLNQALAHPDVMDDDEWSNKIEVYLDAIKNVHHCQSVFCTHEKAFHLEHLDCLVFDEDLIPSMVKINSVSLEDLKSIRQHLMKSKEPEEKIICKHIRKVLQAPSQAVQTGRDVQYTQAVLHAAMTSPGMKLHSAVEAVFTCKAYVKDKSNPKATEEIHCIECQPLREGVTYIVLSATADETMYKAIFGDRVVFHDLSGTSLAGRLLLHTGRSYSKTSIAHDVDEFVQTVLADRESCGFTKVITYKALAKRLTDAGVPVPATFGALEGLDSYGGEDLAIFGTPLPPEFVYRLYGSLLGYDVDMDRFVFKHRPVRRGEFEFTFPTCSEAPELQDIQLYLTGSQLEQAVGRARLVNHPCKVRVFSTLPLKGGELAD